MEETIPMSSKEISRLEVMQRLKDKRLGQKEAAQLLGLSVRQVKRLWKSYRKEAAKGLVSKKRGRVSNNHLDAGVVQEVLDLVKSKYSDFGPTLAHEKIVEVHKIRISRESVRKILVAEGLWKVRRKKKEAVHQMRERRACYGELVQIDGSDHAWFEERGERCTLLVFIDDATGRLVELLFVPDETFFAYCAAARSYLEREGKPLAFYSDKHGIFRVNNPQPVGMTSGLTQFGRAMQELEIEIICANTPQAKGRVERVNQTLQDRLVKELRLRGISTMEEANAYLGEFREDFNRRFAVAPRASHNAHRPLRPADNLDVIFTKQKTGVLSKNLTLQYQKTIYQIQTNRPSYALHNAPITICENVKGEVTLLYKNQPLSYTTHKQLARQSEVVETKHLNRAVPTPPAANHPWRTYGQHLNGQPIQETLPHASD
jgi:transposase